MDNLAAALEAVDAALGRVVDEVFATDVVQGVSDAVLITLLGVSARIARRTEALQIECAAHIDYRSSVPVRDERMTTQFGCRSASELVQRVTRVSSRSAAEIVKAGRAVIREVAPSSGEVLPSDYPAMRGALASGHVGLDGLLAVVGPLAQVASVAGRSARTSLPTKSWPRPLAGKGWMPRLRRAPTTFVPSRQCGRCTSIRMAPSRAKRGRCESAA